jgi:endonuclease/exonuclease/phosphatase family metal-dependent hydrolase
MSHTICTFNVNNLYIRYKFGQKFPGDRGDASLVDDPAFGYLPLYNAALFQIFNPLQRKLAAKAITRNGQSFPDIICLQEVESLIALRKFNEDFLKGRYKYSLLVDSRDFRQIDVAVLSKLEIVNARTHLDDLDPAPDDPKSPWLFSRDCLEVEFALDNTGAKRLTLFINHLKSKLADTPEEEAQASARRKRQAKGIKDIIHARFPGPKFNEALFAVIGDLNDEPLSDPLTPLFSEPGLVDALSRIPMPEDRWTHWFRGENAVSQLDHILLSPALAAATAGLKPRIERRGIGFARVLADGKPGPKLTHFQRFDGDPNVIDVDFRFNRFVGVTPKDYASDHCPVFLEVP